MGIEDIIGVVLVLVSFVGVFYILRSLYKMKDYDYDKLSSHPNVQIGKKFEWRMYSDNPFENDLISIAEVMDLKEKDGKGWVRYKCQDRLHTELISDFVDKYSVEASSI